MWQMTMAAQPEHDLAAFNERRRRRGLPPVFVVVSGPALQNDPRAVYSDSFTIGADTGKGSSATGTCASPPPHL